MGGAGRLALYDLDESALVDGWITSQQDFSLDVGCFDDNPFQACKEVEWAVTDVGAPTPQWTKTGTTTMASTVVPDTFYNPTDSRWYNDKRQGQYGQYRLWLAVSWGLGNAAGRRCCRCLVLEALEIAVCSSFLRRALLIFHGAAGKLHADEFCVRNLECEMEVGKLNPVRCNWRYLLGGSRWHDGGRQHKWLHRTRSPNGFSNFCGPQ